MSVRSVLFCAVLVTITLAGCGSKAIPAPSGPVGDMRDAIAIAIDEGDEAQVKKLVEMQPLLVNAPIANMNYYTPLHCAARAGNASIIQYLLDQGADPYIQDDEGQFPYDVALFVGAGQDVLDMLRIQ